MRASRLWLLLPLGLLLAACGDVPAIEPPEPTTADSQRPSSVSSRESPDRELYGAGTVLQKGGGPAMLCLGGVRTSNPPQCEGPPIAGWRWSRVEGEQRSDGVTWGDYVVVGTFDGSTFTPTRRAVTPESYDGPRVAAPEDTPRKTPCPVPEGGWRVLDPASTSTRSLERTLRVASGLEGFGDAWLDQSVVESLDDRHQNDPRRLVLDVAVTGDRTVAEEKLRQTWGGALCVSKALHSQEELRAVQDQLADVRWVETVATGHDQVDLRVVYDDGTLQRSLDEKYGVGVVVVASGLQPYPQD